MEMGGDTALYNGGTIDTTNSAAVNAWPMSGERELTPFP